MTRLGTIWHRSWRSLVGRCSHPPSDLPNVAVIRVARHCGLGVTQGQSALACAIRQHTIKRLTDNVLGTMGAAVEPIADWLEKLGMSEYAQRLAENNIDFAVL